MSEGEENIYDIAIIGAGPAGIAAAFGLRSLISKRAGKVVLIDKAVFPRDKICGDAVPQRVFKDLDLVCPGIHERAKEVLKPGLFRQTKLQTNSKGSLTIKWSGPGYMIPRIKLDNFLFEEVKRIDGLIIREDSTVKRIVRTEQGFSLRDQDREEILCAKYVIGADGAPSTVVRSLRPGFQKRARSGSAVRGYFSGLSIEDTETSLLFYQKKFSPGYFWLFPLSSERANVGFGMGNRWRQKRQINLTTAFWHFVENEPEVKKILSKGKFESGLQGGMLPFSKGIESVVGEGYALVGDAANLNDPFSGDGIQNAIYSGILAGHCISNINEDEDFSTFVLAEYQNKLSSKLHKGLRLRARLVRISSRFPFLVDLVIGIGEKTWLKKWIKSWL